MASLINVAIQAWRGAINNAKIQMMNQENQLLNIDVDSENSSRIWLNYNSSLEMLAECYSQKLTEANREIHSYQMTRQQEQQKLIPTLTRLMQRRNDGLQKLQQCKEAYAKINKLLIKRGFNFEQHQQRMEMNKDVDANDSRFNSTVREYDTVNETMDVVEDESNDEPNKQKKQKH